MDDNALVRNTLRNWIERDSVWHVCGEAKDGEVAVQKVMELHPDIVILDLQMPVMNGLEAARQIRAVAPHTAMIMLTIYPTLPLLQEAQNVGIRAVVSKSIGNPEHLLASLRNLCSSPMF